MESSLEKKNHFAIYLKLKQYRKKKKGILSFKNSLKICLSWIDCWLSFPNKWALDWRLLEQQFVSISYATQGGEKTCWSWMSLRILSGAATSVCRTMPRNTCEWSVFFRGFHIPKNIPPPHLGISVGARCFRSLAAESSFFGTPHRPA